MKIKEVFFFTILACCAGKVLIIDNLTSRASDFVPVYVAATLVDDGQDLSIYDHHAYLFNIVPPGRFKETAQQLGFQGTVTPYVHLPLFSLLSRPLLAMDYRTVTKLLLMVNSISVLLSLYLITRLTVTRCTLTWLGCALLALTCFYPLVYSLRLGQTTPLVFLGITALYALYKNGYPKSAGAILGGIVCLKIIPLIVLVYFTVKKKWPLVISSGCTIAGVAAVSLLTMGYEINRVFVQKIVRLSGYSLASWNNQSLDGFLLRVVTGGLHVYDWHILALPVAVKMLKYGIAVLLTGIWLVVITRPKQTGALQELLGFCLTVTLMVVLSPIAWTHYLLCLLFPCLALANYLIEDKTVPCRRFLIGGLFLIYPALALPPSYFLKLVNVPLVSTIPVALLSSGGFLGTVLLMVVIVLYRALARIADGTADKRSL